MSAPEYVVAETWPGPSVARKWRILRLGSAQVEAYVVQNHRVSGGGLLCSCDRPGCGHKAAVQRDLDAAQARSAA